MENADLRELLEWYRDAGVDAPLSDEPVDRFAQSEEDAAERERLRERGKQGVAKRATAFTPSPPMPQAPPAAPSVSDAQMVDAALAAANGARDATALSNAIAAFRDCPLVQTARRPVLPHFVDGATLLVLGDGPDVEEDRTGEPFAGPGGELLSRMLASIGMSFSAVSRANALPWRTPGEREPTPIEADIARPFLARILAISNASVVLVMGGTAAKLAVGPTPLPRQRGKVHELQGGARAIVTFNPRLLMTQPAQKRGAWEDLRRLRELIRA